MCNFYFNRRSKSKTYINIWIFFIKGYRQFKDVKWKEIDSLPIVLEKTCGYIIGEVINIIDVNTHDIFLIKVNETKKVENKKTMTYKYYHEVLKGKTSSKAPTYNRIEEKENQMKKEKRYKCTICGYIYDDEKEKIKFEDLPNDWKCPICGVGKDKFIEIQSSPGLIKR